ncbi:MAG: transglycosylase domain-containing protein [Eubacteriales bacterium]|nr:transglycosylase domain-containing protein [Eubacteriales bacterium]
MSRMQRREDERKSGKQKKKKQSMGRRVLRIWGVCLLVAFAALAVLAVTRVVIPVASMYRYAVEVVEESSPKTFKAEQTSVVFDVKGNEIKKLKGEKDVKYLSYKDIPDAAKLAIISVEDKNFTSHRGIDIEGIARAAVALIRNKGEITQGGSTITQQLARNVFLSFETTYSRKIQEMFIAVALEQKYTKEQILEFYLNNVYFANGYYGIESAAEAYFNKEASELTISQIAFLCAIPNGPTRYNPYDHPDVTVERRNKILRSMHEEGYISEEQYEQSREEKIKVLPKKEKASNDYAETYILKCATESLMKAKGFEFKNTFGTTSAKEAYEEDYEELYSICKQSLYTAGYRIYTSIDMALQNQLQTSVSTGLSMFTEKSDDGVYKVQGAAVCIDNETGRVAAIVGGREEDQEGYGLNRAYQSYRQPGSAIKPLLVYAPALEQGYTTYSTVDDSRMTGEDAVSNSGYSYSGSITLRRAVQKSSNVATYRLYQELGPEDCLEYLEKMNFRGLDEKDYKYDTTCLGGFTKGTTAVEMAAGYATLANDGEYREPTCIVKISDAEKNIIVPNETKDKEIYSSNAARMMTDVLESCVTDRAATASGCALDVDMPVACKTGTTTNNVDGWLCGYSPYYTTAVWVGMDVYSQVNGLSGSTYPAYIWKNFMDKSHQSLESKDFESYLGKPEATTAARKTTEKKTETEPTETMEGMIDEKNSIKDEQAKRDKEEKEKEKKRQENRNDQGSTDNTATPVTPGGDAGADGGGSTGAVPSGETAGGSTSSAGTTAGGSTGGGEPAEKPESGGGGSGNAANEIQNGLEGGLSE